MNIDKMEMICLFDILNVDQNKNNNRNDLCSDAVVFAYIFF